MAPPRARLSHLHPILRGAQLHRRLLAAFLLGLVVLAVLPGAWLFTTRLLCAWNVAVGLYLGLTAARMLRTDVARLRQRAAENDEGAIAVMGLAALAALASVAAIFAELVAAKDHPETTWIHVWLGIATIVLSWLFLHVVFAQHYAHAYYGDGEDRGASFKFPGDDEPDYWDFVFFSLVIGMTSQVSGVEVRGRSMRRAVSTHGVVAFIFNTSLIALTVNIAGNVL